MNNFSAIDPVSFSYNLLGRYLSDISPLSWLTNARIITFKGKRYTHLIGGCGVLISEDVVKTYGFSPQEDGHGITGHVPPKQFKKDRAKMTFSPYKSPWMMINFSNTGGNERSLHLNTSGREVVIKTDSGRSEIRIRADVIRQVAESVGTETADLKKFKEAFSTFMRYGDGVASATEVDAMYSIFEEYAARDFKEAVALMACNRQDVSELENYIDFITFGSEDDENV